MFGLILEALTFLTAVVYPISLSLSAISDGCPTEAVKHLLSYWCLLAFVNAVEQIAPFLAWLPLYSVLKLLFVAWAVAPATRGSLLLYTVYVEPLLPHKDGVRGAGRAPTVLAKAKEFLQRNSPSRS